MGNPLALLVDDAAGDRAQTGAALRAAGFSVLEHPDAASALASLQSDPRPIDLVVLDRQLPLNLGDAPSNDVGDDLLSAVVAICPDQRIIVFSGHSDYDHLQFAQNDRGVIELRSGEITFDRVTVLRKGQSLEFDEKVRSLERSLHEIDDIQVTVTDGTILDNLNKRLIRRVGFEFFAVSVSCRQLTGGASDAPVWLCEMHSENDIVGRAVIKVQKSRVRPGGFQALLPAPLLASTVSTIGGFCGGNFIGVQQVAGSDPVALMTLLKSDPEAAVRAGRLLRDSLDGLPVGQNLNVPISRVTAPFGSWEELSEWAGEHGIALPSASKICTTTSQLQHGDLHPGNVLVVDERPVLIDFDRQTPASAALDAVVLTLSPLFHPASTVRDDDEYGCSPGTREPVDFFEGASYSAFAHDSWEWAQARAASRIEFYAVVLGYALRQLRYPDVQASANYSGRAIAIARWAAEQILAE